MDNRRLQKYFQYILLGIISFYVGILAGLFLPIIDEFFYGIASIGLITLLAISLYPKGFFPYVFYRKTLNIIYTMIPLFVFILLTQNTYPIVALVIMIGCLVLTGILTYKQYIIIKPPKEEDLLDRLHADNKPLDIKAKRTIKETYDSAVKTLYLAVLLLFALLLFPFNQIAITALFIVIIGWRLMMMHYTNHDAKRVIVYHLFYITSILIGYWGLVYTSLLPFTIYATIFFVTLAFVPLLLYTRDKALLIERDNRYETQNNRELRK
ncbi:MAG: hypothetical protein ACOCU2_00380 [Bacillota bacterium]